MRKRGRGRLDAQSMNRWKGRVRDTDRFEGRRQRLRLIETLDEARSQ